VYFESKENFLTQAQKQLLQDLALVCKFKATSDLPQWLTDQEREQLRAFLNSEPNVKRIDRHTFSIDEREVDFTSAVTLPNRPSGLTKLWAGFLGWLGNFPFVLLFFRKLDDKPLKKRRDNL